MSKEMCKEIVNFKFFGKEEKHKEDTLFPVSMNDTMSIAHSRVACHVLDLSYHVVKTLLRDCSIGLRRGDSVTVYSATAMYVATTTPITEAM